MLRVVSSKLRVQRQAGSGSAARKCARPATHSCATLDARLPHGFTLIELMVTIAIIAILSTVFLGVSNSAMESGRRSRTKATIAKIHSLLMERWESYETRRVEINPNIINEINTFGYNQQQRGQVLSDVRLLARRELMTLELPQSWSDVLQNSVSSNNPRKTPRILATFPPLRSTYLRRFNNLANDSVSDEDIEENQGAECLYMIVMLATGDGEARTLFSERDIGDTDNDGAPEFLDGWGNPIHFLRWAPGFTERSSLMHGNADADHDPIDVYRRDQFQDPLPRPTSYPPVIDTAFFTELDDQNHAFRLVPLVYSAGPDGETDIDDIPTDGTSVPPTSFDPYAYESSLPGPGILFVDIPPFNYVFGLPYDKNEDGDDNSIDNIHNHLQDNQ